MIAVPAASAASRAYSPKGGALEAWRCRAPWFAMVGPAGTGKTRALLEKVYLNANKYPGSRHLICRKTRASMTQSVLVTWESKVVPEGDPVLQGASRAQRSEYELANGSVVVVGGLDNPDRIMSTEYDTATVFEATEVSEDDAEKIGTRLRNGVMPYQQMAMDLNPGAPSHWIKRAIDGGRIVQVLSRHIDNPTLTQEYLDSLARLTGPRRSRLYLGQWAGADGLVYDNWDRAVHVRDATAAAKQVVVGCDDGFTNPFVALRIEVDSDLRIHVAAEEYRSGLQVSERVKLIEKLADRAEVVMIDPSSPDLIAAARADDLPAKRANNDVVAGINRVAERLSVAGDGMPRLTVSPGCVNLIREMESYEWLPDKPKDTPKKENDHAPDALRYAVMYLDRIGGSGYVAEVESRIQTADRLASKYPRGLLEEIAERRKDPDWGFED